MHVSFFKNVKAFVVCLKQLHIPSSKVRMLCDSAQYKCTTDIHTNNYILGHCVDTIK